MFGIDDAALALLVTGGLSTAGTLYTNARNRQFQRDINDVTVDLANTAHQREVYDLMLAGLNPILSAGGSGAAVPQLTAAHYDNPMQGLADGIGNSARYLSEGYAANTAMAKADASSALSDALINRQNASIAEHNYQQLWTTAENDSNAELHRSEADLLDAAMRKAAIEEIYSDDEAVSSYIDNLKDGLIASAKDASNVNWRNNLNTWTGVINSAANAYSAFRSGRAMPVNMSETIEKFDKYGERSGYTIRRSQRSR